MLSPFLACIFSIVKIRSCLRRRLAPSISIALARSTSSETCLALSSDRCIGGFTGCARLSARGGTAVLAAGEDCGSGSYEALRRGPAYEAGAVRLAGRRRINQATGARVRGGKVAVLQVAVKECRQLRLRQ